MLSVRIQGDGLTVPLPCPFAQAVKCGSDECQLRPAMHLSCDRAVYHQGKLVGIEISIRPVPAFRATTTLTPFSSIPRYCTTRTPPVGISHVFKLALLFVEEGIAFAF